MNDLKNKESISRAHRKWLEPPDPEAEDRRQWIKEGREERDELNGERGRKSE